MPRFRERESRWSSTNVPIDWRCNASYFRASAATIAETAGDCIGLDIVDLVIRLEHEFGVEVPNELATQMVSVGITAKFIVELLSGQQPSTGACSKAQAFHALRRELMNRFGVPRKHVRLEAFFGDLVPRSGEKQWAEIADRSGLRPEPKSLFWKGIPPREMPIRELIGSRCELDCRRADGTIDEAMVFQQIRRIVSDQLGVSIERITHETRYVQDLGAD